MAVSNQAQSIVDFLTSRGLKSATGEKFPLFETRKKLYENLGLQPSFGDYTGSETQNPALLSALSKAEKNIGVSITPENIFDVIKTAGGGSVQPPQVEALQEEAPQAESGIPDYLQGLVSSATKVGDIDPDEIAKRALEQLTGSATFPLEQEAVVSEKQRLQLEGQRETEDFIRKIASRGLIFSGAKKTGVSAIEADTLAKQLGVDRKFAMLIVGGLETAAQNIAKEAVKELKTGRTDATKALETLGFVVTPEGTLIQKPSEARAEAAAERAEEATARAERGEERAIRGEERTEARFQAFIKAQAKPKLISTATLNKLAVAGVPNDVSLNIQENLNVGNPIEDIRNGLAEQLGDPGLAQKYTDAFIDTMQKSKNDELLELLLGLSTE